MSTIPVKLDRLVRERAGNACEYCALPQGDYVFRFPVDHIIAQQHGGKALLGNLCLACPRCNANKGPNIASIDPLTKRLVRLFNPRRHKWSAHFHWQGPVLAGRTPIGRATIRVLAVNESDAVAVREAQILAGLRVPWAVREPPV